MGHTLAKSESVSTVGIVGGGKVGLQLLRLFADSHLTRVVYVVHRDPLAVACLAARREQSATYTDIRQALKTTPADFIFAVTGVPAVAETLRHELAGRPTQLMTHDMAYIRLTVIEEARHTTTELVRAAHAGEF
jgi:predicted dehydrogenase